MYKNVNGKRVRMPVKEANAIKKEWSEETLKKELDLKLNGYKYDREKEYPSIQDQLDLIFHGGLELWKSEIQAIKAKYPKPE